MMKKIITTVGTSLITNALEDNKVSEIYFNSLKGLPYSDWQSKEKYINKIKAELDDLIKQNDYNLSAEISSILKIAELEPDEQFDVYLLATDTILSPLCAEYIKKWFENKERDNQISFNVTSVIKGLCVDNSDTYGKKGITNLFSELEKIIENDYAPFLILNITGGYKSIIPFLTFFGQINNIKTVYKYEDSDVLIILPQLPVNVDFSIFIEYRNIFKKLQEGIEYDWKSFKRENNLPDTFDNYIETISDDGSFLTGLNAVGNYFLKKIENYYLVEINTSSKIFTKNTGNKTQVINALRELIERINHLIESNSIENEGKLHETINNLGDKCDLRHGTNPMPKVYIFKSTNQNQIRIVYSFSFSKGFLKIKFYDYVMGSSFNHSTYIQNFKKKYRLKNEYEFITVSIKKTN